MHENNLMNISKKNIILYLHLLTNILSCQNIAQKSNNLHTSVIYMIFKIKYVSSTVCNVNSVCLHLVRYGTISNHVPGEQLEHAAAGCSAAGCRLCTLHCCKMMVATVWTGGSHRDGSQPSSQPQLLPSCYSCYSWPAAA